MVYRYVDGDEPLVLVVTARKVKESMVFPVGTVENGETLESAAKRECAEESGYYVEIGQKLRTVEVSEGGKTTRFTFFLAKEVGEATTWEMDRKRVWLPLSKVVSSLPRVFQGVAAGKF